MCSGKRLHSEDELNTLEKEIEEKNISLTVHSDKMKNLISEANSEGKKRLEVINGTSSVPDLSHEGESLESSSLKDLKNALKNASSSSVSRNDQQLMKVGADKVVALLCKLKDKGAVAGPTAKMIGVMQESAKKWTQLSIAIDSGACESVIDPAHVPGVSLEETIGSKTGEDFQSATGEPIPNLGELKLAMITRERSIRGMTFTGAPVAKPLGSIKRLCLSGHLVVFDEEGSYIMNKQSGECNMLREEDGNYMLDVWIPPEGSEEHSLASFRRQLP